MCSALSLSNTRALLGAGASVSDVFIRYFGLRALYSSLFMSCSCSCSRSWRVQVVRCPSGRLRAWRTLHIAPMAVSSHRTCCWRVRPSVCRAHFCTVRTCRLSQSRSGIILLPCILQSQPRSTARPLAPLPPCPHSIAGLQCCCLPQPHSCSTCFTASVRKKRMRGFAPPCPPHILVRKTSLPPSSVHTGW